MGKSECPLAASTGLVPRNNSCGPSKELSSESCITDHDDSDSRCAIDDLVEVAVATCSVRG